MDDSINDKLELAVLYFKTEDFVKALNLYNQLVYKLKNLSLSTIKAIRKQHNLREIPILGSIIHPKLSTILDQRAATYEKLNQLDYALKDSKELVSLDPLSCKGYLRQGKILIKLNKLRESYKVYQEGVYLIEKAISSHKLQVPNKLFDNLKLQYKSLNKELKNKRAKEVQEQQKSKKQKLSSDFFERFPIELIHLIFQNLSLKVILSCFLVCKRWYLNLISIPQLYSFNCKSNVTGQEFLNGYKLFKKILAGQTLKEIKLIKINNVAGNKLPNVMEYVIKEPGVGIKQLEMIDKNMSLQLLYNKFQKSNWKLNNFHNLQSLKLGINCHIQNSALLLNLFKRLKELEIVVFEDGKPNIDMVHDKFLLRLKDKVVTEYSLEKLTLINHPNLRDLQPSPPLLDRKFPNLTSFTLVSYHFSNTLPALGSFMSTLTQLKEVYFENNLNINLYIFLQILINYKPQFQLTSFTFRESKVNSIISLNEFLISDLQQNFGSIRTLDLYGNCLSSKSLDILIRTCFTSLTTLNIGKSSYMNFSKHNSHTISIKQLLSIPKLENLYLNELNIDEISKLQISKDLMEKKLHVLDLSFNNLDGVFLINLFKKIKVDILFLHGMDISIDTLKYLKNRNKVDRLFMESNKAKWTMFGVNSFVVN